MAATAGPTARPLSTLESGDCLESIESPWASDFDVVPCEEPHTAQLTAIVPVDAVIPDLTASWPGEEALRERAMLACQSPDALDVEAAASIPDLQVQARWPANEAEWDGGIREYYCFANSAEPFGSLQP